MSIKAFAFDLDGTLADSIPDLAHAANAARRDAGLAQLEEALIESFVGDGTESLVARAMAADMSASFTGTAAQTEALGRFDQHYLEGLTLKTKLYHGVANTLNELHDCGYRLAIVTNKPERFTQPLLKELGIGNVFDVIVSGDTLPNRKPHAEPLQYVMEKLAVSADELLMVGDSKNDILAARAAGCKVAYVSYGYGAAESIPEADVTLARFEELMNWLEAQD
ncbi:phosphoglycolate phosphatase [Iodobacter fluviatilis]|uniref:Phosphoglycolate phosphatase n=1 Tax=Iodobacter fluviatilis TaxID=537 RepID=A0A377QBQ3_9NEIS|nr:phosphoglycolate phosphatase [Iodobacter fluviatilis]TCU88638.1 phosphoglycolate phosphatase [Iodobacter fluviatilis]STQ91291.1 Phosphoglycolate phosphatase [Iodobacter fluviatilis]